MTHPKSPALCAIALAGGSGIRAVLGTSSHVRSEWRARTSLTGHCALGDEARIEPGSRLVGAQVAPRQTVRAAPAEPPAAAPAPAPAEPSPAAPGELEREYTKYAGAVDRRS
ncbi:MAG TPA: hypothetical protein VGX23_14890 [Actinocrinis sp.]|nr:hypothetical protein [Actinocrinis sp.]